jgi:hypothetical protein
MAWPAWWDWKLELTPHVVKRMADRSFSETDLRLMLESAKGYGPADQEGRFVIECIHDGSPWEVIVEPDELDACWWS